MRTPHRPPISILAVCLLAAAWTAFGAEPGASGPAPESSELRVRESAVPMREAGTFPVVDVLVNGRGPYPFILDLSGGLTIVASDVAAAADVAPGAAISVRNPLASGEMKASLAKLELAEVGHLMMLGLPAAVADLGPWLEAPEAPRGVLSAGSFAGFTIEMDFPGRELRIREGGLPPPDGSAVFDLSWSEPPPVLPLKLPGLEVPAHLDPAYAGAVLLPEQSARSLVFSSEPGAEGSGEAAGFTARLEGSASIGRVVVDRPAIRRDSSARSARVGREIIRNLVVSVDPGNARLRLLDTTEPIHRGPRGVERYGLVIEEIGAERPVISNVTPASAAHMARLQHGDEIVEMNGTPVDALDEAARIAALKESPLRLKVRRGREILEVTLAFGEK